MSNNSQRSDLPSFKDILRAKNKITPFISKTPILKSNTINELCGTELFFKAEHLQRTGSFKIRGAMNAVNSLGVDILKNGVVTHSSGNHGQALSLAAKEKGIPAYIVVPEGSSIFKVDAIKSYGGIVSYSQPSLQDRKNAALEIAKKTNATLIPPFNNNDVISGQGTLGIEMTEQVLDLDAIIIPIGGGGLASGIAIACRKLCPSIHLIGAEPAGADDAFQSFNLGKLVPQNNPRTIADGLRTSLGHITWPILRDNLDVISTVSEEEIIKAMKLIFNYMKQVIEPSSGVSVAVALREGKKYGRKVGVILCGGNIDFKAFSKI